jgi:hypothetical protein
MEMIAEAIKRLIMALVFFYLGGLVMAVSFCVAFGDTGPIEALTQAAPWPWYIAQLLLFKYGVITF